MDGPGIPELAFKLLAALGEIETQAVWAARKGGCYCNDPVPGTDRFYPIISFDRDKSIGRPFTEIVWVMAHQPDCPMSHQRGVGYPRDPKCGELSPETQVPCYLNTGHSGAHEASRGPSSISSWAS